MPRDACAAIPQLLHASDLCGRELRAHVSARQVVGIPIARLAKVRTCMPAMILPKLRTCGPVRRRRPLWRVDVLLRRGGRQVNHKKTRRFIGESDLQLQQEGQAQDQGEAARRRCAPKTAPNECWTIDFLAGHLFDEYKIRILSIGQVHPAITDARRSFQLPELDFSRPGKPTDNAFAGRSTAGSGLTASTPTGS